MPTIYKNIPFTTELKARWAVFFDALGIEWFYNRTRTVLNSEFNYQPDIWLPRFNDKHKGLFVDVRDPGDGEFSLARRFAYNNQAEVLCVTGTPGYKILNIYGGCYGENDAVFFSKYLPKGSHGDEYRLYFNPGVDNLDDLGWPDENVQEAGIAASKAVF